MLTLVFLSQERIFGNLDGYSMHNVLLTCRTFRDTADSVEVWTRITDSFWDNLDGSSVSVAPLKGPKNADPLATSVEGSYLYSSSGAKLQGPLRRSHGKRKQIKDSSEVLHQVIYQHAYNDPVASPLTGEEEPLRQLRIKDSFSSMGTATTATTSTQHTITSGMSLLSRRTDSRSTLSDAMNDFDLDEEKNSDSHSLQTAQKGYHFGSGRAGAHNGRDGFGHNHTTHGSNAPAHAASWHGSRPDLTAALDSIAESPNSSQSRLSQNSLASANANPEDSHKPETGVTSPSVDAVVADDRVACASALPCPPSEASPTHFAGPPLNHSANPSPQVQITSHHDDPLGPAPSLLTSSASSTSDSLTTSPDHYTSPSNTLSVSRASKSANTDLHHAPPDHLKTSQNDAFYRIRTDSEESLNAYNASGEETISRGTTPPPAAFVRRQPPHDPYQHAVASPGYGLRHTVSSPVHRSDDRRSTLDDLPPFLPSSVLSAPAEDVLRRWLPTEEEITYLLKESHQVSAQDFKEYYKLIATCLIVDPSLVNPEPVPSPTADPMTIVTCMSTESLEERLLRVNQELWTFGSPHRPLRRRRIFASLPEAIRHARAGDFIYLHKGQYTDPLSISKPIRLCGQMRITESIYLQAHIQTTIHWRALQQLRTFSRERISLRESADGSRYRAAYLMNEPTLRGSISCLDMSSDLARGEPSLVVHPRAAVDVHHSLFRNREGTAVRVASHGTLLLLRNSFTGNMMSLDMSPKANSLGLYKNTYKDALTPDLVTLAVELARKHAKIILASDGSGPCVGTQFFAEAVLSIVDLMFSREVKDAAIATLIPDILPLLLQVLAHAPSYLQLAQNLCAALNVFTKLESCRAYLISRGGLSTLKQVMTLHASDGFVQVESLSALWRLAGQESLRPLLDSLQLDANILDAINKFGSKSPALVAAALGALWNISWLSDKLAARVMPTLPSLFRLQRQYLTNEHIQCNFCGLLWNMSTAGASKLFVQNGAVSSIYGALKEHPKSARLFKTAASLLRYIFSYEPKEARVFADLGGAAVLLGALETFSSSSTQDLFFAIDGVLALIWETTPVESDFDAQGGLWLTLTSYYNFFASSQSSLTAALFTAQSHRAAVVSAPLAPPQRAPKPLSDLKLLTFCAQRKIDIHAILTSFYSACGIKSLQLQKLLPNAEYSNSQFLASNSLPIADHFHHLLNNSDRNQTYLFIASILKLLLSKDPSRLFAVRGGALDLLSHFTSSLPKSVSISSRFGFLNTGSTDVSGGGLVASMASLALGHTEKPPKSLPKMDLTASQQSKPTETSPTKKEETLEQLFPAAISSLWAMPKPPGYASAGPSNSIHAPSPRDRLRMGLRGDTLRSPPPGPPPSSTSPSPSQSPVPTTSSAPNTATPSTPAPATSSVVESGSLWGSLGGASMMSSGIRASMAPAPKKESVKKDSATAAPASPLSNSGKSLRQAAAPSPPSSTSHLPLTENKPPSIPLSLNASTAPSRVSPITPPQVSPSLTAVELASIELARMIFDCYSILALHFDADSRSGRLNVATCVDFLSGLEHFVNTLSSIHHMPSYLTNWARDRRTSMLSIADLQDKQQTEGAPSSTLSTAAAARRFQALKLSSSWQIESRPMVLMSEPNSIIFLDAKFKTRFMLIQSDYATIWNPHASLESIRANTFANKSVLKSYFEVSLQRFEPCATGLLPTASSLARPSQFVETSQPLISVGWCTARSVFFSTKIGVLNEPFCWAKRIISTLPGNPKQFTWSIGDRICCFLDTQKMEISYAINGVWNSPPAFSQFNPGFDPAVDIGYAPAITLHQGVEAKFHYGGSCLYSPPY